MRNMGWMAGGRFLTAGLALLASVCGGCSMFARREAPPAQQTAAVAPLTESEFDEFAGRAAQRVLGVLSAIGVAMPTSLPMPELIDETPGGSSLAPGFARAFVAGLNDRLAGKVRLVPMTRGSSQWRSVLTFRGQGYDPTASTITFTLSDARGPTELLRETSTAAARQAYMAGTRAGGDTGHAHPGGSERSSDGLPPREISPTTEDPAGKQALPRVEERTPPIARERTDPPTRHREPGRIKLDDHGRDFGVYVRDSLPRYQNVTREGTGGKVVFLDSRSYERFWIQSQRASRTLDSRLKVELDIRARGRARDAAYRVVFYDDMGDAIEATSILNADFSGDFAQTLTVTSGSDAAQRYVCLFEED